MHLQQVLKTGTTLSGLERRVRSAFRLRDKVNVVVYADDFIISCASERTLHEKIKPIVAEFLNERGLTLSEEKTTITHISKGFDFLGFAIKKYKKLIIKPSKKNIKSFLGKIREVIKKNPTAKTENLIYLLNPMIRGWANYFRHVCSKKVFVYIDHCIFKALWNWAKRRHSSEKGKDWIWKKYFLDPKVNRGTLSVRLGNEQKLISIFQAASIPIRRHIKIRTDANPYDPSYDEYFSKRKSSSKDAGVPSFQFG